MKNNKTESKSASRKKGPPSFVLDAFGRKVRPGDKVVWTNPISNRMEITTVRSIVNKSRVRCWWCIDENGDPAPDEFEKQFVNGDFCTHAVSSRKVCRARPFPKRNPPRGDK